MVAMLCYIGWFITGIIFLIIEPYNKKPIIRFHAFQSIFTSVLLIVIQIVFGIVIGIMARVVGLFALFGLFSLIMPLVWLGLWLYLVITAYQGKTVVLPIIGPIAQKQAGM